MVLTPRVRKWLPAIAGVSLLLLALVRITLLCLPLGTLKSLAPYAGIMLAVGCVVLYWARELVGQIISGMLNSASRCWAALKHSFLEALRTDARTHRFALALIVLIALTLRLCFLFQPMRCDEAYTYTRFASKSLNRALSYYPLPNNHVFHTLQVVIASRLFGHEPWALRLPAFLAGVLLVPAAYGALRVLANKHAALLTAGLVAASSVLVEFSTNARGYSLLCLIFLLLLPLAAFLMRTREPAAWLAFTVLAALGFYTMPLMVFPFGVVVTWMLLSLVVREMKMDRRRFLADLALALGGVVVLTVLLYTPVIFVSGWKALVANSVVTRHVSSSSSFVAALPAALKQLWQHWNRDIPAALRLVLGACFLISLAWHKREARYRTLLVLAVALWCGGLIGLRKVLPIPRYGLFFVPLYLGLAASGLAVLVDLVRGEARRRLGVVTAVLAVGLAAGLGANVLATQSVYYSLDTGTFRDARAVTLFFKESLQPGDKVLSYRGPSGEPLNYYFSTLGVPHSFLHTVREGRRLLLVVNKTRGETPVGILKRHGLAARQADCAIVVRQYETATIYAVEGVAQRLKPPPAPSPPTP